MPFEVHAPYEPAGDQQMAIDEVAKRIQAGEEHVVLRGVTGVGKTFILAKVLEKIGKKAVILCHNKTLTAQVYEEMKAFLPNNAVEFFISYYDYYQPEAYVPQSDTYIAKESDVNKEIDKLRHHATQSLLTRDDSVVVASVSCIYGLGSPEAYREANIILQVGDEIPRKKLVTRLVDAYYERVDADMRSGTFRVRGDTIDIMPMGEEHPIRVEMWGDEIESIKRIDYVTSEVLHEYDATTFFPAKHFVLPAAELDLALARIKSQMEERLTELRKGGHVLEAARLEQRTNFDMEMIREIGYCAGIENYSQPLSGRPRGDPGYCLLDFLGDDWVMILDESHATVPQIRGMYAGDRQRKETLIDYGFRLPSCADNRPLKFAEWEKKAPQKIYLSATPGPYELEKSPEIIDAVVRPTGLIDPIIEVRPTEGQVDDLYGEILKRVENGQRVLVTTLTKKMSEELAKYFLGLKLKCTYLHSEIDALERIVLLEQLREGHYDVLIGINLLREGLDLPEVSLVAILDADKIGFLRSATSLIQTVGRAARNVDGRVIMYADRMSDAMAQTIEETNRRRTIQTAYNEKHNITPKNAVRSIKGIEIDGRRVGKKEPLLELDQVKTMDKEAFDKLLREMTKRMEVAARSWDFEQAALLRDQIMELKANPPKATKSKREEDAKAKIRGEDA